MQHSLMILMYYMHYCVRQEFDPTQELCFPIPNYTVSAIGNPLLNPRCAGVVGMHAIESLYLSTLPRTRYG